MTSNQEQRLASIKMSTLFYGRRILIVINVVYLRHQPIWIQIAFNIWLNLADALLKIHWSPYEDKLGGFMEKLNDFLVLILSYFSFLFTDLTPTPEDKYFIGWVYNGVVGIMIVANVGVMVHTVILNAVNKIKKTIFRCKEKRIK